MTEELIDKLKKRLNNNIEVTPVYKNDKYEMFLFKFLKSQNYLKPEKFYPLSK